MRTKNRASKNAPQSEETAPTEVRLADEEEKAHLIPLFRLLMKRPPANHDFRTCPICTQYGITEI